MLVAGRSLNKLLFQIGQSLASFLVTKSHNTATKVKSDKQCVYGFSSTKVTEI